MDPRRFSQFILPLGGGQPQVPQRHPPRRPLPPRPLPRMIYAEAFAARVQQVREQEQASTASQHALLPSPQAQAGARTQATQRQQQHQSQMLQASQFSRSSGTTTPTPTQPSLSPEKQDRAPVYKSSTSAITQHLEVTEPKLPSLLSPSELGASLFTIAEAITYLNNHNASQKTLASTLAKAPPRYIDVFLYDHIGAFIVPVRELQLRHTTSLSTLILETQALLDQNLNHNHKNPKAALLVCGFMIRSFTGVSVMDGFPRMDGKVLNSKADDDGKVTAGTGVVWECEGGELQEYWESFRRAVLIDDPNSGEQTYTDADGSRKKPMLKILTVQREFASVNLSHSGSGHEFSAPGDDFSTPKPKSKVGKGNKEIISTNCQEDAGSSTTSETAIEAKTETESIGDKVDKESATQLAMLVANKIQEYKNPMHANSTEIMLIANILEGMKINKPLYDDPSGEDLNSLRLAPENKDAFKKYESMLRDGDKPARKLFMKPGEKDDSLPKDPKNNWGYYQRLGGNPEIHARYPLDHLPFEVTGGHDWTDSNENPSFSERDTTKGEKAKVTMIPYQDIHPSVFDTRPVVSSSQEEIDRYLERKEAAMSFALEDDDIYFPDPVRNPPKKSEANDPEGTSPFPPFIETYNPSVAQGSGSLSYSNLHQSPYLNSLASSNTLTSGFYGSTNTNSLLATTQRRNLGLHNTSSPAGSSSFNVFNSMSNANTHHYNSDFNTMGNQNETRRAAMMNMANAQISLANSNMSGQNANPFGSSVGASGNSTSFNAFTPIPRTSAFSSIFSSTTGAPSQLRADSPAFTFKKPVSPARQSSPVQANTATGLRYQGNQFAPSNVGAASNFDAGGGLTGGGFGQNVSPLRVGSAVGFPYQTPQFNPGNLGPFASAGFGPNMGGMGEQNFDPNFNGFIDGSGMYNFGGNMH